MGTFGNSENSGPVLYIIFETFLDLSEHRRDKKVRKMKINFRNNSKNLHPP